MQRRETIKKIIKTAFGLFVFAFGEYVTIQGNVGLTPWDALSMGISEYVPLTFGQVHVTSALIIVGIDLLLKEKIGIGTILDALLVGTFVDMFTAIFPFAGTANKYVGLILLLIGMIVMAVGQLIYMAGGLSCGPRDSLLIAIGKRMPKVPIGYVDIMIKITIVIISWIIGGPIGFGTLISMFGMGSAMQIVFTIFKFEPRDIVHENFIESIRKLIKN